MLEVLAREGLKVSLAALAFPVIPDGSGKSYHKQVWRAATGARIGVLLARAAVRLRPALHGLLIKRVWYGFRVSARVPRACLQTKFSPTNLSQVQIVRQAYGLV